MSTSLTVGQLGIGDKVLLDVKFRYFCNEAINKPYEITNLVSSNYGIRWRVVDKSAKGGSVVTLLATTPVVRRQVTDYNSQWGNADSTLLQKEFFDYTVVGSSDINVNSELGFFMRTGLNAAKQDELFGKMQPMDITTGDGSTYRNKRIYLPSQAELGLGTAGASTGSHGAVFEYFNKPGNSFATHLENMEVYKYFKNLTTKSSAARFATRSAAGAYGSHMRYFYLDHSNNPILGTWLGDGSLSKDEDLFFVLPVINVLATEFISHEKVFGAHVLFHEELDFYSPSIFIKQNRIWKSPTEIYMT
ncbi:hypothetical protein U1P98_07465 [Lysinibacillus irui]|uniref:Uncharacterized protein n=1 Tax=Lysinibacillus irui TaxID=2998077 RepID=A0ABU5NJB9_9BACI|nr:hypothetical protein [Lysinibacillus irui]MEA0553753.1 hypothetical protein [Lysinibacillus irui]MEA0976137.1 hypothetical protein [Lysinibacillus irui]MEA1042291.1 hypothetical protein [Lysinibacillus irui]